MDFERDSYIKQHGGFIFTVDEVKDMIQVCVEAGKIDCDYELVAEMENFLRKLLSKDTV